MADSKNSQDLNEKSPYTLLRTGMFDRSIVIALLSLVLLSWFINRFLLA